MMPTTRLQSNKVCRVCGRDCSSIARIRDRSGNYYCKSCHSRIVARQSRWYTNDIGQPARDGRHDETQPETFSPYDNALVPCECCGYPSPAQTVLCTRCGYNWQTGEQSSTLTDDHHAPSSCDESCDRVYTQAIHDREAARRRSARAEWRWEHLKPLLMILIGGVITISLIDAYLDQEYLVRYLMGYGFSLAVGFVALWLCFQTWLGADAPMYLNFLRLAGIYCIADAAFIAVGFFLSPIIGWPIMLAVYIKLLVQVFDLEFGEAIMLAVITYVIKIIAAFMIAMWFVQ